MFKSILLASVLIGVSIAGAAEPVQKKDDKTIHHSAMHAEKWLDRHVSAPHKHVKKKHRVIHHKKSKTVHHAVMHAEHWVDHHVSAPHKKKG